MPDGPAHLVGCKTTTNNVWEVNVKKREIEPASLGPLDVGTAHVIEGWHSP